MVWALVAAFFAVFGIIHMPSAGFQNFSQPSMEQCDASTGQCWDYAEQWMYFTSYLMLAATFLLIWAAKKYGGDKTIEDELDDESSHAFDDWFGNAAIDITVHDTSPQGRIHDRMATRDEGEMNRIYDSPEKKKVQHGDTLDATASNNEGSEAEIEC